MTTKLLALLKLSFARDSSYRSNFWATIISKVGFLIFTIAWFNVMYATLVQIKDWDYGQTLFFLATFQIIETTTIALFGNSFAEWHNHIKNGSLDTVLVKPFDNQLLLSLQAISLPGLITIIAPMVLLVIVQIQFQPIVSISAALLYGLSLILSIGIFYSVWLVLMTALFWLEGVAQWSHLFQALTSFMQVPPVIYTGPVKVLFYWILPLFTATILPLQVGSDQNYRAFLTVAGVSLSSLIISRIWFKYGLRHYGSASS